ncbi:MAG: hypothetical protein NTY15_15755 [Planctomycetota bacterium]|nr:hypothetical protein [Planctomycetota bacterium]
MPTTIAQLSSPPRAEGPTLPECLAEIGDRFPTIAREVELLKSAKSLSGFSIVIPAVAISHQTN